MFKPNRASSRTSLSGSVNLATICDKLLLPVILLSLIRLNIIAQATSINYGISHQPITDISQLMPSLCQNQSVICEGSFCIPGIKRCVCDLRQPVQLGRFCLRQVDIETKCFTTSQCNHTIKDAVCTDLSSNIVLEADSSRFKLEQWQQLNELRQASQTAVSAHDSSKQKQIAGAGGSQTKPVFLIDDNNRRAELGFQSRDDVIMSNARNSPYEINYYTPELLKQNHTRRKIEKNDANANLMNLASESPLPTSTQNDALHETTYETFDRSSVKQSIGSSFSQATTTDGTDVVNPKGDIATTETTLRSATTLSSYSSSSGSDEVSSPSKAPASSSSNELSKKKVVVKALNWPPGICSCPPGFMFDSMLRKCFALSLNDSHCLNDNDCKQIRMAHCSKETKKCECDEPLVWNVTDLACMRPKPKAIIVPERPTPPLSFSEFMPDQTKMLLIFSVATIIAILLIFGLVFKCFSSSNPALISPKSQKIKKSHQNSLPKSPYATLRKPEKNEPQMNSFTQATRGRILNYDFEQDNPAPESPTTRPNSAVDSKDQQHSHTHGTIERGGTLAKLKGIKQSLKSDSGNATQTRGTPELVADESLDLNELDSETKSEHSIVAPPQPTTNQPTYMLAGQQSAIAAAAAAVANRRNFGKPEFV